MNLRRYTDMDPNLLLGLVNTALRNDAEDLEDLVRQHDLDASVLAERLASIGYAYESDLRQFRPTLQKDE